MPPSAGNPGSLHVHGSILYSDVGNFPDRINTISFLVFGFVFMYSVLISDHLLSFSLCHFQSLQNSTFASFLDLKTLDKTKPNKL